MNVFEPKVEGTQRRPGTDLPETGNPQSQSPNPQSENPQVATLDPQSENPQTANRKPRFAVLMIALLIIAVSAVIGGLCYDPAALRKPSDAMADNPAVRDFVKAIGFIEDNYAV